MLITTIYPPLNDSLLNDSKIARFAKMVPVCDKFGMSSLWFLMCNIHVHFIQVCCN